MAKSRHQQETGKSVDQKAREAVKVATELIDNWEKGTRTRFSTIREFEDSYNGKVRPRTSGRSNFPVPVLARYLDEVHSRLDNTPHLKVDSSASPSRKLIGRKATAIIKDLKKPSKGNWDSADRDSKRFAEFAGYNMVDFYSEDVDGEFRLTFEPLHHTEAIFEIGGGKNLEKHRGVGKFPIWRTKDELESRAEDGVYSKAQVELLVSKYGGSDFKRHLEFFNSKTDHLKTLGIDIDNNSYAGQQVFPLAQIQITHDFGKGAERYLVTFDYMSGIWVRFQPLKEVFPSGMYSIDVWQTSEDVEITCKSICDDIFPFAEGTRVKINQLFDNHTKRIYGQTVYDPNFFPDPSQLIWKTADQLTRGRAYGGKPIASGFAQMKTEDMTTSTLDFVKYMDEFLTSVVGINPNDVSDEVQKVGLMFGQLQKTAARLGSKNKSYNEMWQRLGYRALHEMKEFLKEPQAISIIGTKGVEWESFVGSELSDPADFDILTEGSNVELEMSEARKKKQQEALTLVLGDPDLKAANNIRSLSEAVWRTGEWSEDEISKMMDTANYGNEDMLARADLACEEIIKKHYKIDDLPTSNKKQLPIWSDTMKPKLYPGADISFVKYIMDFASKLDDSEHDDRVALMAYGRAHKSIVIKNMANQGVAELSKKGIPPNKINTPMPPGVGAQQTPPQGPPPAGANPQPSPQLAAKVQARGPRPIGHMPVRHAPSMKGKLAGRKPSPAITQKIAAKPVA